MAAWIEARLEPWSRARSRTVGNRDGGSGAASNRRASSGTMSAIARVGVRA